jgi:hypothetical protein
MSAIHFRDPDTLNNRPVSRADPLPVSPGLAPAQLSSISFDNAAAAGDAVAVGAASGQTTKVYRLLLVAAAATTIVFKDGSTVLTGPMALAANEAMVLDFDGEPWFTGSLNTNFIVNSSGAVQVSGRIYFIQS